MAYPQITQIAQISALPLLKLGVTLHALPLLDFEPRALKPEP